jgi:hypothetical protein
VLIFFASSFCSAGALPENRRDTRRMWQGMTPECDAVMKVHPGDWHRGNQRSMGRSDAKEQGRSLFQSQTASS